MYNNNNLVKKWNNKAGNLHKSNVDLENTKSIYLNQKLKTMVKRSKIVLLVSL